MSAKRHKDSTIRDAGAQARDGPRAPNNHVELGPIDRGVLWGRLRLTQSQLAQLTGLSQRQISRWAAKGYLVAASGSTDRYNGDAVEQVVLMQRAIARGYAPAVAARMASEALAHREDQGNFSAPVSADVYEKLASAQRTLSAAIEVLFPSGTPT